MFIKYAAQLMRAIRGRDLIRSENVDCDITHSVNIHISKILRKVIAAVIWPKYCRYGVKHHIINQSIEK